MLKTGDKIILKTGETGRIVGTYSTKYKTIRDRIAVELDNYDYSGTNYQFHLKSLEDLERVLST